MAEETAAIAAIRLAVTPEMEAEAHRAAMMATDPLRRNVARVLECVVPDVIFDGETVTRIYSDEIDRLLDLSKIQIE